jgi:hypothetical protein
MTLAVSAVCNAQRKNNKIKKKCRFEYFVEQFSDIKVAVPNSWMGRF